jgi:programmed cell death protein 5
MSGEEYTDEELEEIRRRRMAELQRTSTDEQRRARAQQQVDAQKQSILRQILAPEARQRLTNIKMVRPEFAEQLELQLMQLAQSGKVRLPISDQQLKEALTRMQSQRREIRIRRQ